MATNQYLVQMAEMKRSYISEGTINSRFTQLEEVQDENKPYFLEEVVEEYYETSYQSIEILEDELNKSIPIYSVIGRELQRYKQRSISIGAANVVAAITEMQECLRRGDLINLKIGFGRLKELEESFETKIERYMDVRDQTLPEEVMKDEEYEFDDDSE